jgi:hypothetical protein
VITRGPRGPAARLLPFLALVSVVATALTGCAATAVHRVGVLCEPPPGRLETGVVLMAQAVPSASFVPCVNLYPAGWTLASLTASRGQAAMTFDSDRGGMAALRVTFVPTCRPLGTAIPPDILGANGLRVPKERARQLNREFGPAYTATRYYTFPGGCMVFDLKFAPGTQSTLTTDAAIMVNLVPRRTLEDMVAAAGFSL